MKQKSAFNLERAKEIATEAHNAKWARVLMSLM